MKTNSRSAARRLSVSTLVGLFVWALHAPVLGGARENPISLPDADWQVDIKLSSFKLANDQFDAAGTSRRMAFGHTDARLNLSVSMRPASTGLGETRSERLQDLRGDTAELEGERQWERDQAMFFEYVVTSAGRRGPTKHVHAFLVAGETAVEIHFVNTAFKPSQQRRLDSLTESLQIIPRKGKG